MPVGIVGHEIDGGECAGVAAHALVIDAFSTPEFAQLPAVRVVADGREVAGLRTLARRGNHEIRGVAAEALQEKPAAAFAPLVELDHGLAEGQDVEAAVVVHGHGA